MTLVGLGIIALLLLLFLYRRYGHWRVKLVAANSDYWSGGKPMMWVCVVPPWTECRKSRHSIGAIANAQEGFNSELDDLIARARVRRDHLNRKRKVLRS